MFDSGTLLRYVLSVVLIIPEIMLSISLPCIVAQRRLQSDPHVLEVSAYFWPFYLFVYFYKRTLPLSKQLLKLYIF